MRVLIIGDGGRETAMARALCTATPKPQVLVAPGNAGTARFARNVPVAAKDIAVLVALAKQERIDLVIPGGEVSLVGGIAGALAEVGIPCCGPVRAAAQLEGSKAFTRTLAHAAKVPSLTSWSRAARPSSRGR